MTTMNFTGSQHGGYILENLCQQRREGRFCDMYFHVQSQEYPAHRNVLAACSPYFYTIDSNSEISHLGVECKTHHVFEIMLDYIYTGTIVIDHTTVEELILLANKFLITKLKGYCSEYLEKNINVTNCFMTSAIAQKCGLWSLSKKVDAFLLANMIDIVQQEEILCFTEKKMHDFISNKTLPVREELKIHIINRWVHHELEGRQHRLQHLLGLLSWDKVNVSVAYTLLNEDNLYKASEWCLYSMLNIMNEKEVLSSSYKTPLNVLQKKFPHSTSVQQILQVAIASPSETNDKKNEVSSEEEDVRIKEFPSKNSSKTLSPELCNQEKHVMCPNMECVEQDIAGNKSNSDNRDNQESDAESVQIDGEINQFDFRMEPRNHHNHDNEKYLSCDLKDKRSRGRHKRKGIPMKLDHTPIKVRIPKTKLKLEMKHTKKRGRPHKLVKKNAMTEAQIPQNVSPCDEIKTQMTESEEEDNFDFEKKMQKKQSIIHKGKQGRKRNNHHHMSCKDCKFNTSSLDRLKNHMEKAHKDKIVYTCPVCDYQSSWNREYYNHMKTHFSGPPFLCDFSCGYSGDRIQQLLYHRMTHTDERPFECTVCNMCFRSKNNLAMHMRCHTGMKPFKCEVCNRGFATKGTLDQHSVTHSDLRPYLCDLCGFSTKYQSHLIAHKRIHSGDVFKCQYPNCKYFTPKRSQLACHMRTHMSIRSHICSVCGRAFIEKSHLVRHEKIHLEEKPFKCEHCDYSSTRRDKLKDHVTKYHGQTTSQAKTPYKPRKARRQTFEPHAFPFLSSEQASQEMQTLLQQSDLLRQKDQQDLSPNILQTIDSDTDNDIVFAQTVNESFRAAISTSGVINTTDSIIDMEVQTSGLEKNIPEHERIVTEPAALNSNSSTITFSSTVQSMLPSLIDPRLPVMLGSNQQPILVIPQTSVENHPPLDYSSNSEISSQTMAHMQSMNQSAESPQVQTDFPTLQTFMNIF